MPKKPGPKELRLTGAPKKRKVLSPAQRKRQLVVRGTKGAISVLTLAKEFPTVGKKHVELLRLSRFFIDIPQEKRTKDDAIRILDGLKAFRKAVRERGQLKLF